MNREKRDPSEIVFWVYLSLAAPLTVAFVVIAWVRLS